MSLGWLHHLSRIPHLPEVPHQALSSIIKIESWKQHMSVVNKDSRGPISLGGYSILVQILDHLVWSASNFLFFLFFNFQILTFDDFFSQYGINWTSSEIPIKSLHTFKSIKKCQLVWKSKFLSAKSDHLKFFKFPFIDYSWNQTWKLREQRKWLTRITLCRTVAK